MKNLLIINSIYIGIIIIRWCKTLFHNIPLSEITISKKILKNISIKDLCENFLNIDTCSSIEEYEFYIKRYIFNNHKEIHLNQYILKTNSFSKIENIKRQYSSKLFDFFFF